MTYSTACSKSWTDVNVDFKRGTIGHCCKSVYYDFPDEYTSEFFTNSKHIQNVDKILSTVFNIQIVNHVGMILTIK